jgi:hypothetical protein
MLSAIDTWFIISNYYAQATELNTLGGISSLVTVASVHSVCDEHRAQYNRILLDRHVVEGRSGQNGLV